MDFVNSPRAGEDRIVVEMDCCKIISGAPTTSKGYEID